MTETDPPTVDLSVRDIRLQIAAEWLQIAQWSQWTAYSKHFEWYHHWPLTTSPFPKWGSQMWQISFATERHHLLPNYYGPRLNKLHGQPVICYSFNHCQTHGVTEHTVNSSEIKPKIHNMININQCHCKHRWLCDALRTAVWKQEQSTDFRSTLVPSIWDWEHHITRTSSTVLGELSSHQKARSPRSPTRSSTTTSTSAYNYSMD